MEFGRKKVVSGQLVIRVDLALYADLEAAAKANERTVTQEVRLRLRKGSSQRAGSETSRGDA